MEVTLITAFLAALIGFGSSANGQATKATRPAQLESSQNAVDQQPSFTIALSTSQQEIKVGGEVKIRYVITNASNHQLVLGVPGARRDYSVKLDVRDSEGKEPSLGKESAESKMREAGIMNLPTADARAIFLDPGKSAEYEVVVSKMHDLLKPGKYTIKVSKYDTWSKTEVYSNTVIENLK